MKVNVFIPSNDALHNEVLTAFAAGARARGNVVDVRPVEDWNGGDVAVVFGTHKAAVPYSMHRGLIIKRQRLDGGRLIILEAGYVRRDRYFAAGFDGLNGRANFMNRESPADRWEALDVTLKPWRKKEDGYFLVCGQVPWDASVQHTDHIAWCSNIAHYLLEAGEGREVRFRAHPLARQQTPMILGTTQKQDVTLKQEMEDAYCVVTFNSNSGVDAAIAGVPVGVLDAGSMLWGHAPCEPDDIVEAKTFKREQWAHDLAYAQWTVDEMRAGLTWEHLFRER